MKNDGRVRVLPPSPMDLYLSGKHLREGTSLLFLGQTLTLFPVFSPFFFYNKTQNYMV